MSNDILTTHILIPAGFLLISALLAALGWFIKSRFDKIDEHLQTVTIGHTDCRETLPLRFADKEKTERDIKELYQHKDDHAQRIRVLEEIRRTAS